MDNLHKQCKNRKIRKTLHTIRALENQSKIFYSSRCFELGINWIHKLLKMLKTNLSFAKDYIDKTSILNNLILLRLLRDDGKNIQKRMMQWDGLAGKLLSSIPFDYDEDGKLSIHLSSTVNPFVLYNLLVCLYNSYPNPEEIISPGLDYLISQSKDLPGLLCANCLVLRSIVYLRKSQYQSAYITILALEQMLRRNLKKVVRRRKVHVSSRLCPKINPQKPSKLEACVHNVRSQMMNKVLNIKNVCLLSMTRTFELREAPEASQTHVIIRKWLDILTGREHYSMRPVQIEQIKIELSSNCRDSLMWVYNQKVFTIMTKSDKELTSLDYKSHFNFFRSLLRICDDIETKIAVRELNDYEQCSTKLPTNLFPSVILGHHLKCKLFVNLNYDWSTFFYLFKERVIYATAVTALLSAQYNKANYYFKCLKNPNDSSILLDIYRTKTLLAMYFNEKLPAKAQWNNPNNTMARDIAWFRKSKINLKTMLVYSSSDVHQFAKYPQRIIEKCKFYMYRALTNYSKFTHSIERLLNLESFVSDRLPIDKMLAESESRLFRFCGVYLWSELGCMKNSSRVVLRYILALLGFVLCECGQYEKSNSLMEALTTLSMHEQNERFELFSYYHRCLNHIYLNQPGACYTIARSVHSLLISHLQRGIFIHPFLLHTECMLESLKSRKRANVFTTMVFRNRINSSVVFDFLIWVLVPENVNQLSLYRPPYFHQEYNLVEIINSCSVYGRLFAPLLTRHVEISFAFTRCIFINCRVPLVEHLKDVCQHINCGVLI